MIKFYSVNFVFNDAPLQEVDDNKIKALIELKHRYTTPEIDGYHSTVHDHLKKLRYTNKLDIWDLHEHKEVHLMARINICDMLIKRKKNDPFLKRLLTGEEK